jgi:hypothetical protein
MLNELFEVSKSLEHHGLLQANTHPNISTVGKCYSLLIEVDKNGIPMGARLLQKDETSILWKHSKGNHNSFPAIRVQKPLLAVSESKKIDQTIWIKAKLSEKLSLLNLLDFTAVNAECTDIKINDWSLSQLEPVLRCTQPELSALRMLIMLFPRSGQTIDFLRKLLEFIYSSINQIADVQQIDFLKDLLIGNYDMKNNKYVSGCMTYYDVYETSQYTNLVASLETKSALINLLNNEHQEKGKQVISFLSGQVGESVGDKYPNPNMPILGLTFLYSKKSDTPCLSRYNLKGSAAFSSGKNEIMAINDAISFLTDKERENKSWKAMSDSNHEKPNLLLAYLPDDPQNNAFLAEVLGDPSDYESDNDYREEAESAFEALCGQVLGNIEIVLKKNPNTVVKLIMLESLDPGRKQIVYENTLTASRLRKNLFIWAEAAQNHPPISIRVNDKKSLIEYKPFCLGPNDICQLMKINYTRSSIAKPMKQSTVSLNDIYKLYMPGDDYSAFDSDFLFEVLCRVIEKTAKMIGDTGSQLICNYTLPSTKESHTRAKYVVKSISLISILLWRLGVRKEFYMNDAPFNVGQFLQLSDMLHKEYCIQVRNGGNKAKALPSQLMGNEVLAIAAENPIEGLNRLRDRMRIYLAWANTVVGEGSGLIKWILARLGEVSVKIAEHDLPEHLNAAEQAQVLLGYLATIQYEKKNDKGVI